MRRLILSIERVSEDGLVGVDQMVAHMKSRNLRGLEA